MGTAEFKDQVDRAQSAIDDGDVLGHGAAWRALQAGIPCLDVPVPVDAWAKFLVGYAVVEHALGRDWEPALRTALRIQPAVSRDYGPEALRTWTPTDGGLRVDVASGVWIDGVQAESTGALTGPHILQRRRDGAWESQVVTSAPLPDGWEPSSDPPASDRTEPVVVPDPPASDRGPSRGKALRIAGWSAAGVGAIGGLGSALYTVDGIRDPDGDDPWSETEVTAVKAVNIGAWSLFAVGTGVAVVGHVQRGSAVSVNVGPRGVGLHVRR